MVRLLPHYRILRRLSHRTHGRARRAVSGRLSRRRHGGVPRLRSGTHEQWHLEGSAVERDLQGSYRWTRLRPTDRWYFWLAVAPLIRPARTTLAQSGCYSLHFASDILYSVERACEAEVKTPVRLSCEYLAGEVWRSLVAAHRPRSDDSRLPHI